MHILMMIFAYKTNYFMMQPTDYTFLLSDVIVSYDQAFEVNRFLLQITWANFVYDPDVYVILET